MLKGICMVTKKKISKNIHKRNEKGINKTSYCKKSQLAKKVIMQEMREKWYKIYVRQITM